MIRFLGVVVSMVLVICGGGSGAHAETYRVFGEGTKSCAEYVQSAERNRRRQINSKYVYDYLYASFVSFANGYLSGANMMDLYNGHQGVIASGSDINGRMLWLENWCRQNPLSHFTDAMLALAAYFENWQKK